MTNEEAIKLLSAYLDFKAMILYPDERFYEAIETAVAALDTVGAITIDITEHHTFANPDDVSNIDFPGTGREDK